MIVKGAINKFFTLLTLLVLVATFPFASSLEQTSQWHVQTVDSTKQIGSFLSIALDSKNNPHIAYCYDNRIEYTYKNGSDWVVTNVSRGGGRIGLVLDANDTANIVFNDISGHLFYARANGSSWDVQMVTKDGASGFLALDSAGNPHIAFLTTTTKLQYASLTSGGWQIQTIDDSEIIGQNVLSLALDKNNSPHILYSYQPTPSNGLMTIVYASFLNSSWKIEPVIFNAFSGGLGNLVLDSKGLPHFTYILPKSVNAPSIFNITITYVNWNGSIWNIQKIISNINWGASAGYLTLD